VRGLEPDAKRIIAVQAARAVVYGLGAVVIGSSLAHRGLSGTQVGVVLVAILTGTALVSVLLGRYGDRIGRRRCYRLLLATMAVAGSVFAVTDWLPALVLAGLTGTLSVEVVESGPFTTLEQAMLPNTGSDPARLFGTYNTVATLAGSAGALIAIAGSSPRWLLAYPLAAGAGLLASARLSTGVDHHAESGAEARPPLHRSRGNVLRMAALFALDSLGGGFIPQTFIAYLLTRRYGASPETLGIVFFAIGILQAASFQAAVRLAGRFGLLRTMVFTHLPSNLLLIGVAFAPNLATAVGLLLGRFAISQMDVPARQAFVVAVVDPSERTAAVAYTNTARYLTRPIAPIVAGAGVRAGFGVPFLFAGVVKCVYDLGLYLAFRNASPARPAAGARETRRRGRAPRRRPRATEAARPAPPSRAGSRSPGRGT
jgi:predicted MFS family arabinose efflux permease